MPLDGKKLEKTQGLGTLYVNGVEASKHTTDWEQHALAALDDPTQPIVEFHPAPIRLVAPYVEVAGQVPPPPPAPDPVPPEEDEDPADPPPPTSGPAPEPPTVPPMGTLRRNMPSDLVVFSDYGFGDAPPPHQDTGSIIYDGPVLGGGWKMISWGTPGGGAYLASDPEEITGSPWCLEERYPAGARGGGTAVYRRDVPRGQRFYLSWVVKWDADFQHNGTSEKLIYLNDGDPDYALFQFHWGSESIYNIRPDPNEPRQANISGGDNSLRANLMPSGSGGLPLAPPLDGQWCEYELLLERATGRVRWWLNGELRADHIGRVFPSIFGVKTSTTWGGGGQHDRQCSRYTGHITIAYGG